MSTGRDQSDQHFLVKLQRLQPATVQELCDAIGVTATAVRQRLLRGQSEGWVTRDLSRQERGRPRHTYRLTPAGVRQLGDDYAEIATVLWREILKIEEPHVRRRVLDGVKQALIKRFGESVTESNIDERLRMLSDQLVRSGFDVELAESEHGSDLPILREHNCPYHDLAATDSSICELEQSVYAEILGVPVELSACQLDGQKCCEFHVSVSR